MSNLNQTTLIGRVGQDPKISTFANGDKVANFSLATSMKYKDQQGQPVEKTEWHNIAIKGKIAEVAERYVKKGDLLLIQGRGENRTYEKDGVKHTVHEVVVHFDGRMQMFGKTGEQPSVPAPAVSAPSFGGTPTAVAPPPAMVDDDLPF